MGAISESEAELQHALSGHAELEGLSALAHSGSKFYTCDEFKLNKSFERIPSPWGHSYRGGALASTTVS